MALTRTLVGTGTTGNTTDGTSHDSTFNVGTVATGDLLVILVGGSKGNNNTTNNPWTTPAKSSGTATIGTVTAIGTQNVPAYTYNAVVGAWQVQVTGDGTLVLSYGDALTTFGCDITVVKYTGHDTTTPVAGVVTARSTCTDGGVTQQPNWPAATSTLGATPDTADQILCWADGDAVNAAGKGWTPGTDFTELTETTSTSNYCMSHVQYRTGTTSTTVTWPTHDDTPDVYSVAGIAFIVKASAASDVQVDPTAGAATGTGYNASPSSTSVAAGLGAATVAGSAAAANLSTAPTAGAAAAAGHDAVASTLVVAGLGAAAGAGYDAQAQIAGGDVNVNAGLGAATVAGYGATPSTSAAAGLGSATVAGYGATPSTSVAAGLGAATVAGYGATVAPSVTFAAGSATGTGHDATASIGAVSVDAGLGAVTATGYDIAPFCGHRPVVVSADSRWIEDELGNPWPMKADAAWSVVAELTQAQQTVYLDRLVVYGFNSFYATLVETYYSSDPPNNSDADSPFTGTLYQSDPNEDYWVRVDWLVEEAGKRGITVIMAPVYLGNSDTDGVGNEISSASNAQMTSFGEFLGARYANSPNIVWMIGGDRDPDATHIARTDALVSGIQTYDTTHLVTAHPGPNNRADSAWSSAAWTLDLNNYYENDSGDVITPAVSSWNDTPTRPYFEAEPAYRGESYYSWTRQHGRFQLWGPWCAGSIGCVLGNAPRWHFEAWTSGSGTWRQSMGLDTPGTLDDDIVDASIFHAFLDGLSAGWETTTPDTADTFLTAGELTGTSRATARFDTNMAVVYMPTSRNVTLDLTELSDHSVVSITRIDPIDGSTSVLGYYATTGSQVVSGQGTNSSGSDSDWALLIEGVANVQVDPTAGGATGTGYNATVSASVPAGVGAASVAGADATANVSVVAGLGAATVTGYDATPITSGLAQPSAGAVTATGYDATVQSTVPAGLGAASVTGYNATAVIGGVTVSPTAGAATATGYDATTSRTNVAGLGAATGTGYAPTATVTALPSAGAASVAGYDIIADRTNVAGLGAATATGYNPILSGADQELKSPMKAVLATDGRTSAAVSAGVQV